MRVIRKALIVGTFLIASIVVMYSTVGKLKKTVREDERVHPSSRWAYGYRLSEYRFLQASHLSIWTPQMKLEYTLGAITIDEVVEARWLSQREAIYLRLHATVHDSINSPDSIRIIYDFERGTMYVCANATLWRVWGRDEPGTHWVTAEEFNGLLQELERVPAKKQSIDDDRPNPPGR